MENKSIVQRNPNAFMGLSSASVTALLVYEAKTRLGVELDVLEAGFIVAIVTSGLLFLGKKV